MSREDLKLIVKEKYSRIALQSDETSSCCSSSCCGPDTEYTFLNESYENRKV
jgi:hypothetical protein